MYGEKNSISRYQWQEKREKKRREEKRNKNDEFVCLKRLILCPVIIWKSLVLSEDTLYIKSSKLFGTKPKVLFNSLIIIIRQCGCCAICYCLSDARISCNFHLFLRIWSVAVPLLFSPKTVLVRWNFYFSVVHFNADASWWETQM